MRENARLIQRMKRIEENFDKIYVRVGFEAVPFSELSAKQAMQWIFKWMYEVMEQEIE